MVDKNGTRKNKGQKSGKLRYFFLDVPTEDGKTKPMLHRSLHINRGADVITTWCYPLHKRVAYTYSDTKKHRDPAFTTQEVCKMLMRSLRTVEGAILEGAITPPQYTYSLDEHRRKFKYLWHESNILELHEYFSTIHRGRPRADGLITPAKLPTVRELRAIIRNEPILYVQDDDGEFRPTWQAKNFD